MTKNDRGNTLHGGINGFDRRFFDVSYPNGILAMTLCSPNGDQGKPKRIGADIGADELRTTNGYDHNFVLRSGHAAGAYCDGGISLDIYTDMPGLHFYSGNYLNGFDSTHDLHPREGFA